MSAHTLSSQPPSEVYVGLNGRGYKVILRVYPAKISFTARKACVMAAFVVALAAASELAI